MGTEKTLPAVILEKTHKIAGTSPPLDYDDHKVTYQAGRIIREAKVKLYRQEGQDQIKIAVEVLDGQQVLRFRLASLRNPGDPPNYSDLEPPPDAPAQIVQIELFAPHRGGYHWTVFVGDYPDATKKHFRSRLELSQMASVDSEFLRILVTHLPNTWQADNTFRLESEAFPPHPPHP